MIPPSATDFSGTPVVLERFDFGIHNPGLTNCSGPKPAREQALRQCRQSGTRSPPASSTSNTNTSVTLVAGVDLTGVDLTTLVSQVVMTNESGRRGVARNITAIAGQTIDWADNLPAGFTPALATVQTLDPRAFTWLLTVRNNSTDNPGSSAHMIRRARPNPPDTLRVQCDVVVFYHRPFGTTDETVFGPAHVPVDPAYGITLTGPRQYDVTFPAGSPGYWKRGGFLLDVDNVRWYRITNVESVNNTTGSPHARKGSRRGQIRNAAIMRGVVDVFPLGDMAPQQ